MTVAAITGALGSSGRRPGWRRRRCPACGFALVRTLSGAATAGHWAESVPSPPPTAGREARVDGRGAGHRGNPVTPAVCDVAQARRTSGCAARTCWARRSRRAVADLPERAGGHRRRAQAARLHAEQPTLMAGPYAPAAPGISFVRRARRWSVTWTAPCCPARRTRPVTGQLRHEFL